MDRERCSIDRATLWAEWNRLFDRSALELLLRQHLLRGTLPGELIGSGTHFMAFRLAGSLKGLTLSIAKPAFLRRPRFKVEDWVKALQIARSLKLPLIGPFDVIAIENADDRHLGLVQLYGEGPKENAAIHWGAIDKCLQQTFDGLAEAGIAMDDLPQIRCRGTTPFLIDYSDLRLLNR